MAQKVTGYIKLQIPAESNPCSAGWSCTGSAWCEYHGIHKGIQRKNQE